MLIEERSRKHAGEGSPRYVDRVEPVPRFAELMRRPDTSLDEALFTIAAAVRGPLDLIEQLARLDELAATCPSPTAEGVVRHLFRGPDALLGDRTRYDDPENSLLDRVLDRRRGMPITLASVAIEVARRLGVPLVGVGLPAHFLVAEVDPSSMRPLRWFDCFDAGAALDERACEALYRRASGDAGRFDAAWLQPVTSRQIIVRVLNNLKASAQRRGDLRLLQRVMHLRMGLAELALAEHDEMARLMAPYN